MTTKLALKNVNHMILNLLHLKTLETSVIESLDKIQYIEYHFEGQIIKRPPDKLNKHQKEI